MHEALPLSKIQEAVLEFLERRKDVVLHGAHAVNAYVTEPRMSQDVDVLSTRAPEIAEELRKHLSDKFNIEVRIRTIGEKGFRLYQIRNEGNRDLADVRSVERLPDANVIENILILTPPELIASKVISYHSRKGKPKAGTDWRDFGVLLLRFPELQTTTGEVRSILENHEATEQLLEVWNELVAQDFSHDEDDDLSY